MRLGHFFLMINEYNREKESRVRMEMEQARLQTTVLFNVHVPEEHQKKPHQLWKLPWDEENQAEQQIKELPAAEFNQAYKDFINK
jgi:hypothetical protein